MQQHISAENPAKGRIEVCLDNLLSSNFCQILGHEKASKYLSSHGPKLEIKDRHNQALSSQRREGILLPNLKELAGCHLYFDLQLAPLAELVSNLVVLEYFVT